MDNDEVASRIINDVEISRQVVLVVDAVRLAKARKSIRCYAGRGIAVGAPLREMEWQGTGMDERLLEDFIMGLTGWLRDHLVTTYGVRIELVPPEDVAPSR